MVIVQLRADQISTLSTNGGQNTVMAGEGLSTQAAVRHSLRVYVAFQKAECVRKGNLLPGTAKIRNSNHFSYILNDSSVRFAWACFGSSLCCFSIFFSLFTASLVYPCSGHSWFFFLKSGNKEAFFSSLSIS